MNISSNTPKKRGRPAKVIPKFFCGDCPDLNKLSKNIAMELGVSPSQTTIRLAHVGGGYGVMSDLQQQAELKRAGKGNRPKIHLRVLLRDCALIYEAETGKSAKSELKKIGGWEEAGFSPQSEVRVYAKAVLAALGINHNQSLRHQARRALELI